MLKEYRLNGLTYLLDEIEATRLGATPVAAKAATPRTKARTPRNKAKADQ